MILHSGGAKGADSLFEQYAVSSGITVKAYSFKEHSTTSANTVILSMAELKLAVPAVIKAAKVLGKGVPYNSYIWSLICRNWYQIKDSQYVYGVGTLCGRDKVNGGTGWAIAMAMDIGLPILFFDQTSSAWNYFDYALKKWTPVIGNDGKHKIVDELDMNFMKKYYENITGIGSRTISLSGNTAIGLLFNPQKLFIK